MRADYIVDGNLLLWCLVLESGVGQEGSQEGTMDVKWEKQEQTGTCEEGSESMRTDGPM